jgi:hypothetical protein
VRPGAAAIAAGIEQILIVVAAKRGYRKLIVQCFIEFAATNLSKALAAEAA